MASNKEILELIEAYLEDTMSPQARLEFEQRLKEDQELADTWKLNQEVDRAIHPKIVDMANLLEGLGDEFAQDYQQKQAPESQKPKSAMRPFLIFLLVGIIALLTAFFWWNSKEETPANPEQIFAEAYEPYPISTTIRSTEDPLFSELEIAQKAYENGAYTTAIEALKTLLEDGNSTEKDIIEVRFYKGLSHLGNENIPAAKQELDIVLASNNLAYIQQTQWYLALIELKNNNPTAAKVYLNNILAVTEEGKYAKKAKGVLRELGERD